MINTPVGGVKADLGPRVASLGAGAEGLGSGLESVGQVLQGVSTKIANAKIATDISNADASMLTEGSKYEEGLRINQNTDTWLPNFNKESSRIANNLFNKQLAPEAKQQIQLNYSHWNAQMSTRISGAANVKRVNDMTQDFSTNAALYESHGDAELAKAEYGKMLQNGLISESKYKHHIQQADVNAEIAQIQTGIGNDPQQIVKDLEDPRMFRNITAKQRITLSKTAGEAARREHNNNFQQESLDLDAAAGNGLVKLDEQYYRQLEKAGKLSSSGATILINKQLGKIKKENLPMYEAEVIVEINRVNSLKLSKPEYEAEYNRIRDMKQFQSLDTNDRTRLNQDMVIKDNPLLSHFMSESQKNFDKGKFVRYTPGEIPVKDTKLTIFGLVPEDKEVLKTWKESSSKPVIDDATKQYSLYIQRMNEFADKNPKANYEELASYSSKLMLPHTINQVSAILNTRILPISGNLPKRMNEDGLIERGNVNLMAQPKVKNADGSISTVDSIGVNIGGVEILLPTVTPDGRHFKGTMQEKAEQATAEYKKTGLFLGKFKTSEASDRFGAQLHNDYAAGKYDYKTDKDVIAAVKSGSLSKEEGSNILMNQFGYSK